MGITNILPQEKPMEKAREMTYKQGVDTGLNG